MMKIRNKDHYKRYTEKEKTALSICERAFLFFDHIEEVEFNPFIASDCKKIAEYTIFNDIFSNHNTESGHLNFAIYSAVGKLFLQIDVNIWFKVYSNFHQM